MGNLRTTARRMAAHAAAILIVAAIVVPATIRAAGWSPMNAGLPGVSVTVNSLAIDPASPSTLYAQATTNSLGNGLVAGLFKSTDAGVNWNGVGTVTDVNCVAIDPSGSSTVYVGTSQGVVKSTDAGATWTDVSGNLPVGPINRLLIDPSAPSTLYAVSSAGAVSTAVFKSTDGGATWNALNTGLPGSAYITLLVIDPSHPSTIYVFAPVFNPAGPIGVPVGGLLRSMDGGQTWNTLNSLPSNAFVNSMAVDPLNSSNLYLTTNMGLQKSTDAGQTWNVLNLGLNPNTSVNFVVIDRAAPSVIYAYAMSFLPTGLLASLIQSTDGGATWTTLNLGLSANNTITSLVIDPTSPSRIYLSAVGVSFSPLLPGSPTSPSSIFRSSDAGATWSSSSAGLMALDVRTVAVSAANTGVLYAGGFGGVSRSTDGATWSGTGLTAYTGTLVADSANANILFALTGRTNGCDSSDALLLGTYDGGATWSSGVSPLNSGCVLNATFPALHATPMAIDPADPATLYLGESDDQDGYSAVLKSTNNGGVWDAPWDWFNGLREAVMALAVDPSQPATIYAGIDDGSLAGPLFGPPVSGVGSAVPAPPGGSGLFKSVDGGETWTNTGLTSSAVNLLAIDPATPGTIYAAIEGHYSQPAGFQGIAKSVDGGQTWQVIDGGLAALIGARSTAATALVIDPADSQVLYLGTSDSGVFRSTDGGATWSPFNDGLASLQVRSLAADPSHNVYAATSGGVFKYSDQ